MRHRSRGSMVGESRLVRGFRSLSRMPWCYGAAEMAVDLLEWRGWKPYQVSAIRCAMHDFRHAYTETRPCIYTTAFVPTELVYGIGAVPFLPEAAAGYAAAFGLAQDALSASESMWYSADLCSFHRAGVGGWGLGIMPRPSAVIATSHLCDGGKKSLHRMSQDAGCPFYLLDVPYDRSRAGERRLRDQVEQVILDVRSRVPGISQDGMAEAIMASNEALGNYLEVCRLRRHSPSPWSGGEALNYVVMFLWAWGSPWLARFYDDLAEHLGNTIARGSYPSQAQSHRLLWLNLRPYYKTDLLDYLETELEASVAFEEFSWPYWNRLDPDDPCTSIARKMLQHYGWGLIERRLAAIDEMVDDYSIDGVIQFAQWGCRQSNGGASTLADHLKKRGIPFLNLGGDGVDVRNGSEAQAMTRLGAFVELLDAREAR